MAEVVDPASVHAALDQAMPDGLDIVEVVESPGTGLADLLQASRWRISLPVPVAEAEAAVAAFLAAEEVLVHRMTKKGMRDFDSRAAVLSLAVTPDEAGAVLDLVLRHLEPAVRPDDVLSGLTSLHGLELVGVPLLTRLAQGPLDPDTGEIGDPLRGVK